jgi:hypothetical protein
MCAYNVFFENFNFWVFHKCLKILRRVYFFTPYSVHIELFLPHTQYTWNNFYRILSTRGMFFAAYSVGVEYFLPHTR